MKNKYKILIILLILPCLFGFLTSRYGPWWGLREQASAPTTPANGVKFWCDSSNNVYVLNESGANYQLDTYDPNAGLTDPSSIGTLTLGSGSITDSLGAISFGNETLTTSGIIQAAQLENATGPDTDTELFFYNDRILLIAGGQTVFDGTENDVQDTIDIGAGADDIDVAVGKSDAIFIEGSSGNITLSGVIDAGGATSFEIPNANADVTANAAGEIFYDEAEDQFVSYDSQGGELAAEEFAISPIKHISLVCDPGSWYDFNTTIFIMTVGDEAPSGIIIDEWKLSCNVDPDVEIDADLRYADAWIGLANAADIDEIDTASGVSGEDTDASINGGVAVANGKVVYIGFDADPEGTCTQMIFEVWYHAID